MPRLRRLSGAEVITILERFGFRVVSTRGSHVKLQRQRPSGGTDSLHVPLHRELDTGTCRAILRQASQVIPAEEIEQFFYID